MNFYKHVCDQQLFNKSKQVNYTAGYVYFMMTPGNKTKLGSKIETDSWQESYLYADQIDRRLVNKLKDKNFALEKEDQLYQSAAVQYIVSKTLSHYFGKAMRKQKNNWGVSIYKK